MATIESIVRNRKGRAGSNGAWRIDHLDATYDGEATVYALYHYSTEMLVWADCGDAVALIDFSTGHGSVSDQNGMNQAFRALGLNLYYSRRNGATVKEGN